MDPAETEPIKAALARQGLRLGQHESMLQGVMETLQNLSAQVTSLTEQLRLSDRKRLPRTTLREYLTLSPASPGLTAPYPS